MLSNQKTKTFQKELELGDDETAVVVAVAVICERQLLFPVILLQINWHGCLTGSERRIERDCLCVFICKWLLAHSQLRQSLVERW